MRAPVNFCQVCGTAMIDRPAHGRLRRVCPACGYIHFADPKVAVVVFIEQDQRVLLVRRSMNPMRGKWALPAGYVDDGEDPQAAVVREVREETSLRVEITQLVGVESGPDRAEGAGASIVILYTARVLSGEARARDDADAICWYAATDPLPDIAFESTHTMLTSWIARQQTAV